MPANSVVFNPFATSNFTGSFSLTSDGYVQGSAMDDPAIRNALAGGVLATTETLPMIGGALIAENVSGGVVISPGTDTLGGAITRAASLAAGTGFSVINQAHHWITSPQSTAPVGLVGSSVHFYRFGSGARIPLAIDPGFAQTLQAGGAITQQVSWDFVNQKLIPYNAQAGALPVRIINMNVGNSQVYTVDASGAWHWLPNGSCALALI